MANLARGVFGGSLPWHLVGIGMALGVVIIALDQRQAQRQAQLRFGVGWLSRWVCTCLSNCRRRSCSAGCWPR